MQELWLRRRPPFLGVSEATLGAAGTTLATASVAYGAADTAKTAEALAKDRDPETGRPLTDEKASRMLGGMVVGAALTLIGGRSLLRGGGGGGMRPPPLAPAIAGGPTVAPRAVAPVTVTTPVVPATIVGVGTILRPALMSRLPDGPDSPTNRTPDAPSRSEDGRSTIEQLPEEKRDAILARIVRGDKKGRAFGTPANPRMPTTEEFNPRFKDIRAGDLETSISDIMHGPNEQQAASVVK